MIAVGAVLMQIAALGAAVYLAVIGHWGIGLVLVAASQLLHFLIEKTAHLLMGLYERRRFSQEDKDRLGGIVSFAEAVSDPYFLPDEVKKMQKDFTIIAKIGGLAYIGISIVMIFLLIIWGKGN